MSEWSVSEPGKLSFDEPVREVSVRVVAGTVNVVGSDEGSARLEVSRLEGPPLIVTHRDGALSVAYEDLPWKGFLKWLDPRNRGHDAVVTLTVPTDARVEVGVVSAAAVVSGIAGRTDVKGVSGDATLVGLSGQVRADTVSGSVEAQALGGDLRFNSVSGDLTVIEAGSSVKADSVSGSMIVDLDPTSGPTDISLTNISGEIAIRLPHPADAEVEANTTSGSVSNAFEDLKVTGQWGAKRITGRLGAGNGKLRATTVSGSIALLRRPATTEEEESAWEQGPPVGGARVRVRKDSGAGITGGSGADDESGTGTGAVADRGSEAAAGSPADSGSPADGKSGADAEAAADAEFKTGTGSLTDAASPTAGSPRSAPGENATALSEPATEAAPGPATAADEPAPASNPTSPTPPADAPTDKKVL